MKRLLAFIFALVLFLCTLTSCTGSYVKNEFFSDELLTQSKLTDMPMPPHMDNSVMRADKFLYLNLTKPEYEQYVTDLLEYLRAKEDIYYLGYSIGRGLWAEMMPYNEIAPITDSYDTSDDSHDIFYSTENRLGNNDFLGTPIKIRIVRTSGKLKFDNYEYNTQICLYSGYSAAARWNLCGAEHTYGEGIEYIIPGRTKVITEYTCVNCGETKLSDFIGDMNIYNITIEDTNADHYIIDRPKEGVSGVIYRIKTQKLIDADLKFTVNGTEIRPRETDDDKWVYEFVMPCEDIVIRTELIFPDPV